MPENCEWMDIGFAELGLSKWSMDYQRMQNFSLRLLADTATAIPALTEYLPGTHQRETQNLCKHRQGAERGGGRQA